MQDGEMGIGPTAAVGTPDSPDGGRRSRRIPSEEREYPAPGLDVDIRPMRPDDGPECRIVVAECWDRRTAQASEPEFAEAFGSSAWRPTFYVAEGGQGVVGTAGYNTSWLSYGIYNLFWVGVRPGRRGEGIARRLVDRCLADLLPIADAVMLMTGVPEFYEKGWGFKRMGTLPQNEGFGDVLMVLKRRKNAQRDTSRP